MDVYDFTMTGCDFDGQINAFDLSRDLIESLNVADETLVQIYGDYYVQFDNGYPLVIVNDCYATNPDGNTKVSCNSYIKDYFQDMIQEQLSNTWDVETKALEHEAWQYENDIDDIWSNE